MGLTLYVFMLSLGVVVIIAQPPGEPCGDLGGPCQNEATCQQGNDNGFHCVCSPEFQGKFCEIGWCGDLGDFCQNDGVCEPDGSGVFQCTCTPEFEGVLCQDAVGPVVAAKKCEDGLQKKTIPPGSLHRKGNCVNFQTAFDYSCQGECDGTKTCVAIPGKDIDVAMKKKTKKLKWCPVYKNPVIKACECRGHPDPAGQTSKKDSGCKLVKSKWKPGSFRPSIEGETDCENTNTFNRDYCEGKCRNKKNKGKRCTGSYDNEFIEITCKGGKSYTRAILTAKRCGCE